MPEKNLSPKLPVPLSSERSGAVAVRYVNRATPAGSTPSEPTAVLSHYIWILARHRWKILGFIAFCVLTTWVLSSRLTPIYEATAIVDIDREQPEGVMGQDAMRAAPSDSEQFLATQIRLIQSDSVLRPVVEKFHLREHERQPNNPNRPRLSKTPVYLRNLTVSRPANTYLLLISYRSPDRTMAADVANAVAESFIQNSYNIRFRSSAGLSEFMEKQLEQLRAKMESSSAAVAKFERELNVINPEEKTSILSARLLQLNTEYTNAQAERVKKESAYQVKKGSIESAQVSSQGETLKRIIDRLNDAQEKLAEIKTQLGPNHPDYKRAAALVAELEKQSEHARQNISDRVEVEYLQAVEREKMLQRAVAQSKTEFDRLNARSLEYHAVKGEAEADKKFYDELIHKIKEAGINSNLKNNTIRLANSAGPPEDPVYPRVRFNVLLAFLFSSCIAVGAALIADMLDRTVRDPEQIRWMLNARAIGTLPLMRANRPFALMAGSAAGNGVALPNRMSDMDMGSYLEAVRTLRNAILLGDMDRRLYSILVTSASPREGKTTTAVHLAAAHAEQRHRTLLIDCDLRRPSVHSHFGIANETGVTTVLTAGLPWRDAVVEMTERPNLYVMPSGPSSRQAAELAGIGLGRIIEEASKEFELIIVDAPPMLGFAEPLQIATLVDGVIVVTLAGKTDRQAVNSVLTALHDLKAYVIGVVLNSVHQNLSEGYYYSGYHGKNYGQYYNRPDNS